LAGHLADPKRLCVLESLSAGELSVSDLAGRVACQVPNMSQHLAVPAFRRSRDQRGVRAAPSSTRLTDPRVLEGVPASSVDRPLRREKGSIPMIKTATDATFEAEVLQNDKPVVVDFWAAWCGPCKLVAPEMEKLAAKYEARSTSSG